MDGIVNGRPLDSVIEAGLISLGRTFRPDPLPYGGIQGDDGRSSGAESAPPQYGQQLNSAGNTPSEQIKSALGALCPFAPMSIPSGAAGSAVHSLPFRCLSLKVCASSSCSHDVFLNCHKLISPLLHHLDQLCDQSNKKLSLTKWSALQKTSSNPPRPTIAIRCRQFAPHDLAQPDMQLELH